MFFQNCETLDKLKKEYRKLAVKYHPDISREENAKEKMAQLNAEYSKRKQDLANNCVYSRTNTKRKGATVVYKHAKSVLNALGKIRFGMFTTEEKVKRLHYVAKKTYNSRYGFSIHDYGVLCKELSDFWYGLKGRYQRADDADTKLIRKIDDILNNISQTLEQFKRNQPFSCGA